MNNPLNVVRRTTYTATLGLTARGFPTPITAPTGGDDYLILYDENRVFVTKADAPVGWTIAAAYDNDGVLFVASLSPGMDQAIVRRAHPEQGPGVMTPDPMGANINAILAGAPGLGW